MDSGFKDTLDTSTTYDFDYGSDAMAMAVQMGCAFTSVTNYGTTYSNDSFTMDVG